MLQRVDVSGVHFNVDAHLQKYVTRKIGRLDRYIAHAARASAHAEVRFKESNAKGKKQCSCEVILHVPHDTITVQETTINMYAATDIAEEKLKQQLRKYKELHTVPKFHRRVIARIRRGIA